MNLMPFENAFDDFLQRREYDQAEDALFSMVRIAFMAGWLAAGGRAPQEQKVFRLVTPVGSKKHKNISEIKCHIETDIEIT